MAAKFRLAKLLVRGFRGIRELDLDIPTGKPLYLIGANNSGKSTVIDAVALALRAPTFIRFEPDEYDLFHNRLGQAVDDFTIQVAFEASQETDLPVVQGVGNPVPVHGVLVRGWINRKGQYVHRRMLIDAAGDPILLSRRTSLKGAAKVTYGDRSNVSWERTYARLDDIPDEAPEVIHLTPQNLVGQLYQWRSGPIKRLSGILSEQFLNAPWDFPYKGRKWHMPEALGVAYNFFRDAINAVPFWAEDMRPRLQKTLTDYIGGQATFELAPDVRALHEWLADQLVVAFATEAGGAVTPLTSMGDGWQSLVRLATLDVLNQYPGQMKDHVVLLFEEPETHLHPHLRRKMRDVLQSLAEKGWTVLSAIHAPEMVSLDRPQLVVRLWRHEGDVVKGQFDTSQSAEGVRFQEKLSERGNHEMLFAHRVVLCEGKDRWAVRSALAKIRPDLDMDTRSVSFVDTGGVGNMPDYADIASRLRIPWCAVTDEDRQPDGTIKNTTAVARQKLSVLGSKADASLVLPGDLEACLGAPANTKATPQWQAVHIDPKPLAQMLVDHPSFMTVCNKIVAWIDPAQNKVC